eukprot:52920_1
MSTIILLLAINSALATQKYNVLFMVADDLRADLGGHYGNQDIIYTPNIDSFQNRAFTFTHAYTQQALCGPTRASFLTGTRPDTTRVWDIGPYFRDRMINNTGKTVITLPQYFKEFGDYYTIGSGKIFHPGSASGGGTKCNMGDDMPYSWSEPYWDCDGGTSEVRSPAQSNCTNGTGCVQSQACLNCLNSFGCATQGKNACVCGADCDEDCFTDSLVATNTLKYFAQVTQNGTQSPEKPFFIAVGLKRPHLGFFAPLKYYQQYGHDNNYSDIVIAQHTTIPQNAPIKASNNASGPSGWDDTIPYVYYVNYTNPKQIPNGGGQNFTLRYIDKAFHTHLRGGYYSAVSWMDSQFGRIIQGLYEYGLFDNTVVAFTGDHGWHLGEQGCWAKFTNYEVSVRVPLIIRIPGVNEGMKSDVLVEQLDMFPTLIEASGLGFINKSNITKQLEGKSLVDIIKKPNIWKDYYAYSQYPRGGQSPDYNVMGISMRTSQWRYTEWLGWNAGSNTSKPYPLWNVSYGIELYNHSNSTVDENDMNAYDNYNLAYDDNMKDIVSKMHD